MVAVVGRLGVLELVLLQVLLGEASWPVRWPLLLAELAGLLQHGLQLLPHPGSNLPLRGSLA